jgi:hypothetical protein
VPISERFNRGVSSAVVGGSLLREVITVCQLTIEELASLTPRCRIFYLPSITIDTVDHMFSLNI